MRPDVHVRAFSKRCRFSFVQLEPISVKLMSVFVPRAHTTVYMYDPPVSDHPKSRVSARPGAGVRAARAVAIATVESPGTMQQIPHLNAPTPRRVALLQPTEHASPRTSHCTHTQL